MANPFLNDTNRDVETALMLERAIVHDIGKAVAYTDGDRVFLNTEDNLFNILPAYDHKMLKWLLWHEKMHLELKHHNRFFKYLSELDEKHTKDEFGVTKSEVNIIMDILVHDWMASKFPELVETAVNNLAQMRNRNSLKHTFKTFTLEEMLEEYANAKKTDDKSKEPPPGGTPVDPPEGPTAPTDEPTEPPVKPPENKEEPQEEPEDEETKGEDEDDSFTNTDEPVPEPEPEDEHDKTDWSKLEDIEDKEFIKKYEGDDITEEVNRLKRKKIRIAKLTETLNGLTTSTRKRSYAMPSTIYCGGGVLLKGSKPGRTLLHLCFDASGSMGSQMDTFKEIISKTIPQAMETPTTWFSGNCYHGSVAHLKNPKGRSHDYYKGTFKDFMNISAYCGYNDDGDRTIELCLLAEQAGYCPIGITDGGYNLSWSKDMIKQLQRTILVGQNRAWLETVKAINPKIQILDV